MCLFFFFLSVFFIAVQFSSYFTFYFFYALLYTSQLIHSENELSEFENLSHYCGTDECKIILPQPERHDHKSVSLE